MYDIYAISINRTVTNIKIINNLKKMILLIPETAMIKKIMLSMWSRSQYFILHIFLIYIICILKE